jgi:tagatose 1,6-diphosphate aldolase
MGANLTIGKRKGIEAVSSERGVIAALAIDQRTALRRLFAKASGFNAEEIPAEWLVQFKEIVSECLTPYASAILLDPEYGLSAASLRKQDAGLLLAYEQSGYEKTVPGRMPRLLEGCNAAKLKGRGADAVKVLLYYSPFSDGEINSRKQDWVERVGEECRVADVAFFLEIVSYHDDMDEKGAEFARLKPQVVTRSAEEFCKPRYAVDVLKIGVPVNMKFVESPSLPLSETLYSRAEAIGHFRRASQACTLPFIYLSEGVNNEMFVDALRLATEAGSEFSGVLCGRATWQDGVPILVKKGAAALKDWLAVEGVRNIQNVNAHLAGAKSWRERVRALVGGRE